jgi:tetratricopeptide (TPR) repeat protein
MISEAYISGQVNKAIFVKDGEYFILERTEDNQCTSAPIRLMDFNSFLLAKSETEKITGINWTEDQLCEELNNDAERHEILELFLMGMDTSFSEELRREAMEIVAGTLFTNVAVEKFVKNRVFGTPVPKGFDPQKAFQIAEQANYTALAKWYQQLTDSKSIIVALRNAWTLSLLDAESKVQLSRQNLDKDFTDKGIFADFVFAVLAHNERAFDTAIVKHSDTVRQLGIGQSAIFLYEIKSVISNDFSWNQNSDQEESNEDFENDTSERTFIAEFNDLINEFSGKTKRKIRGKKGEDIELIKLGKFYHDISIPNQIAWIKDKIASGDLKNAEKEILSIIRNQDIRSDPEHLCKSLCDIAEYYQKNNMIEMSDLIAGKAIDLNPDDSVPHNIIAENFRAKNKLEDAINKYGYIINTFNGVVAHRGKAETLRQMGKLPEALKVYNEIVLVFGIDVITLSGKAETLRQMGRLSEALECYNETIQAFSKEVIPRTAKAETLRQMGRLLEALECYNETILEFSNDVFAHTGKAETLRQMGRLPDALECYNETIRAFNNSVFAHTGKAETLRQMGRLPEALESYNETIGAFSNDVVARAGKAETLRQMGRLTEALEWYDEIIQSFSNNVVARSGKAETLRQMGKLSEALECYNETIQAFSNNVVACCGKAETLRQMGKLLQALDCYNETIQAFGNDVIARNGKAETLKEMGKLDEALSYYDETCVLFPSNEYAKIGRLALLMQMGKDLTEVEKLTNIKKPVSHNDWVLYHIHCMLLLKLNRENAIGKLKYGVDNDPNYKSKLYFKSALSYAYIKRQRYGEAIAQLKQIEAKQPVHELLITHALAADKNIIESKKHFNNITNSPVKKIKEASKYISDRYHINSNSYFPINSKNELDNKILALEFELLSESFNLAA